MADKNNITAENLEQWEKYIENKFGPDISCDCKKSNCKTKAAKILSDFADTMPNLSSKSIAILQIHTALAVISCECQKLGALITEGCSAAAKDISTSVERMEKLEKAFHMLGENEKLLELEKRIKKLEKERK
jgi:hypothetical protein